MLAYRALRNLKIACVTKDAQMEEKVAAQENRMKNIFYYEKYLMYMHFFWAYLVAQMVKNPPAR